MSQSPKTFLTSLTRISDLEDKGFETLALPRAQWATGDYVVCEVIGPRTGLYRVEITNGRRPRVQPGQQIVGALGKRLAIFECVGDWELSEDGEDMHAMTAAGLIGKVTSSSPDLPGFMRVAYRGHAARAGAKLTMRQFASAPASQPFTMPVIMIFGTSMSSGKTTAGQAIIRELVELGFKVAAAKLTGGAGHRDVLTYADSGADAVFDFVDAGLPSTVCSREEFLAGLDIVTAKVTATGADVLVAEAGASTLDPYNVDVALEALQSQTRLLVLSAHDMFGVLGIRQVVDAKPDLITGPVANTASGCAKITELTGIPAIGVLGDAGRPALRAMLSERLKASA